MVATDARDADQDLCMDRSLSPTPTYSSVSFGMPANMAGRSVVSRLPASCLHRPHQQIQTYIQSVESRLGVDVTLISIICSSETGSEMPRVLTRRQVLSVDGRRCRRCSRWSCVGGS